MAKHIGYYEYDRTALITCPVCDWVGESKGHENYSDTALDVECPGCQETLLVVAFATLEETREAAAAGNQEAIHELRRLTGGG